MLKDRLRFFYVFNAMLGRYAIHHGLRDAYRKSLEIYSETRDVINNNGHVAGAGGNVDEIGMLIDLQFRLKARYGHKGETFKARGHRLREGWYERFAPEDRPGIDIGCQYDPLNETFRRYDHLFGDGDAALMEGIPDRAFFTVYASHVLEHMVDPVLSLRNWYRILKPGGHLIVMVPHRDMYEKKTTLPSTWNGDHKWFWLPDRAEEPHTLSLEDVIRGAGLEDSEVVSLRILDEGYDRSLPADEHAVGEFSIEAIIKRNER